MMIKKIYMAVMVAIVTMITAPAFAEWTPLINSADFTGIRTDLGTAVAGVITLVLIVFGVMMMVRTMIGR